MSIKRQQGASLVLVIFLLLLLSSAATVVSYFAAESALGVETSYHQAQARLLARSALEHTVGQLKEQQACPDTLLTAFPGEDDYTITLSCTAGLTPQAEAEHQGCDLTEQVACYFAVESAVRFAMKRGTIKQTVLAEVKAEALAPDDGCNGNSQQKKGNNCETNPGNGGQGGNNGNGNKNK